MSENRRTDVKVLVMCGCILIALASSALVFAGASSSVPAPAEVGPVPDGAAALIAAYPAQKLRYADNRIVFLDGTVITYDDGREKSFEEKLDDGDVEDMFSLDYDLGERPGYLADAGRVCNEQLFRKMYGDSAVEICKRLVDVDWFGEKVKFTSVNGAAGRPQAVAGEIAEKLPGLRPYMTTGGTFVWRKVLYADRMSSHSYGIAIDIAVASSDYWRWTFPQASETDRIDCRNRIPLELVRVFEKHGFIWGGRWYHYDTMHFECRPEVWYNIRNRPHAAGTMSENSNPVVS